MVAHWTTAYEGNVPLIPVYLTLYINLVGQFEISMWWCFFSLSSLFDRKLSYFCRKMCKDTAKKRKFFRSITQFRWSIQFIFSVRHAKTMSIIHGISTVQSSMSTSANNTKQKKAILQMSRIKYCTSTEIETKNITFQQCYICITHLSCDDSCAMIAYRIHFKCKAKIYRKLKYIINVLTSS